MFIKIGEKQSVAKTVAVLFASHRDTSVSTLLFLFYTSSTGNELRFVPSLAQRQRYIMCIQSVLLRDMQDSSQSKRCDFIDKEKSVNSNLLVIASSFRFCCGHTVIC